MGVQAWVVAAVAAACACRHAEADRVNMVLLGSTGNLAEKYLWQGLYNIFNEGLDTGDDLYIVPAATKSAEQNAPILERVLKNNITADDPVVYEKFMSHVTDYVQLRNEDQYESLAESLESSLERDGEKEAGRLLYLSVPPKFFGGIAANVDKYLRPKSEGAWLRVIVEKPFGVDEASAKKLALDIYESLKPEELLLVDHYMGKSVMQGMRALSKSGEMKNLLSLRKNNVESIEVGMLETDDCKGRTGFYDEVGVIRDTMQNHLMMMLALVGMDFSETAHGHEADARKAFFEKLPEAQLDNSRAIGQYHEYMDHVNEDRVKWGEEPLDTQSGTPTFAHITLKIAKRDHFLSGIPIHFVSGKALHVRRSYVEIVFKDGAEIILNLQGRAPHGESGEFILQTVDGLMDFKPLEKLGWTVQDAVYDGKVAVAPKSPFAYQVLLKAGLEGHREHFVRLDEVLESWRVWTPLLKTIEEDRASQKIKIYENGFHPSIIGEVEPESSPHDEL